MDIEEVAENNPEKIVKIYLKSSDKTINQEGLNKIQNMFDLDPSTCE